MKLTNGQKVRHMRHHIEMIGRELGIYKDSHDYDLGTMLSEINGRIAVLRQEAAMYRMAKSQVQQSGGDRR